jgi:hypothetical protein
LALQKICVFSVHRFHRSSHYEPKDNKPMRWTLPRHTIATLGVLAIVAFDLSNVSAWQATPQSTDDSIVITAESFCSQTKLRTTNARIRWSIPKTTAEARGIADLAATAQVLEATVYKNGFDKDLMVSLPLGQTALERPVAAQVRGSQARPLRAFQISLIEVERPRAESVAGTTPEMGAVVEGLEPGVTYTWRVAITTGSGRMVSPTVAVQATVCPADIVRETAPPRRKP